MGSSNRRATNLRDALGLDQDEMGALLGVNLRTISRLEAAEEVEGGLGAALVLLEQLPVEQLSAALTELGVSVGKRSPGDATTLADGACLALHRVSDLLPKGRRVTAWGSLTLGELLAEAWGHGRPWVYWATSAGTDAARTRALADKGIIARSISSNGKDTQPYLFKLRPGDQILLCHDGHPFGWYRLLEMEVPPRLGDPKDERRLPPIFRVLKASSMLGKELAADGYPRLDGSKDSAQLYTALAVARLATPPHVEPPEPRRPGERFTVTPYFKSGE